VIPKGINQSLSPFYGLADGSKSLMALEFLGCGCGDDGCVLGRAELLAYRPAGGAAALG
jgi:hypothetical protein